MIVKSHPSVLTDTINYNVDEQKSVMLMGWGSEAGDPGLFVGVVLSAWGGPVARVGGVECVLREELGVVLLHFTGPASGTFRQLLPLLVLLFHLGLHGRWRPFLISAHIGTS